tara:strand:+ start:1426 stop:1854 length:429 start_codon:yes stop_codon:yes gene_type:complete
MALTQTSLLQARISLLVGSEAAYTNRLFDKNFTLDQSTEEVHSDTYFVDGTVTDQAISLGKVNTPTFIYIHFESKYNGDNSTTDNEAAPVTMKIDGGTAYQSNYFLAGVTDQTNDAVTSTITFSTASDTDTIVTLLVLGRSS